MRLWIQYRLPPYLTGRGVSGYLVEERRRRGINVWKVRRRRLEEGRNMPLL